MLRKMWNLSSGAAVAPGGKGESCAQLNHGNTKEQLFADLHQEVRTAAPSAQLSASLRFRLEKCDFPKRQEVCAMSKDGCSPLFIACKRGNVEIVEYLIDHCGANVEQRGRYEVPDDRTIHTVTPLWCASVAGMFKVVEVLVRHGADVNCVSDTGSTPVRSACFMTHLEIVRLLVQYRANIQRPNFNGGTCLINSVQSVQLCEFLLESGANVNAQDIQLKTALHYAIQEHRFETTKLLLRYKADPFLESKYKDDALQTACLKGAAQIFEYLVDHIPYQPERVASAFELLGSTFLDEHHDSQRALQYWRAAADIRDKFRLAKRVLPAKPQYCWVKEFTTRAELEGLALDLDAMRTQSLLICERILGTVHKDMIYRLMYRGAAYADSLQYQHCINLWKYALELRVAKDSILFCDTCFTAQALVKLFLDLHDKHSMGVIQGEVRLVDVTSTIELLVTNLSECSALLELQPQFKRQLDSFDKVLRIITHLLHLAMRLSPGQGNPEMNLYLRRRVHSIVVTMDPRTTLGDSLLHLAVARNNTLKSQNLFEGGQYNFFPSLEVARLIVECGGNVNGFNKANSTPLHTAVAPNNYSKEIVELLLDNGAHIDLRNAHGQRPTSMMRNIPECQINPLRYTTLRCLAAAAVTKHGLRYKDVVPHVLEEVIEAH